MNVLRRQLLRRPWLAALVLAAALAMRLLVPTGTMVGVSGGTLTIELCSGAGPMKMTMAVPGTDHRGDGHARAEQPCAYAGLSAPSLAGADPVQLALAAAFVIALGLWLAAASPVAAPAFLRPPLRGPPAAI